MNFQTHQYTLYLGGRGDWVLQHVCKKTSIHCVPGLTEMPSKLG